MADNAKSTVIEIEIGMPQGSLLDPLLFHVHCSLQLFADDTLMYMTGIDTTNLSESIDEDLINLHETSIS